MIFFGNKTQKIEVNDANFNQKIKFFKPEIVIHLASYLTSSMNGQMLKTC